MSTEYAKMKTQINKLSSMGRISMTEILLNNNIWQIQNEINFLEKLIIVFYFSYKLRYL